MITESKKRAPRLTERDSGLISQENALPKLDRQHVLLYLLAQLGTLTEDQIKTLADCLYADATRGVVRPLSKVCQETRLIDVKSKLTRDMLLSHIGLRYQREEMETAYSASVLSQGDQPTGLIDTVAGFGSARPLLYDLYLLSSNADYANSELKERSTVFTVGTSGKALANAMQSIFDRAEYLTRGNILIVVGK